MQRVDQEELRRALIGQGLDEASAHRLSYAYTHQNDPEMRRYRRVELPAANVREVGRHVMNEPPISEAEAAAIRRRAER